MRDAIAFSGLRFPDDGSVIDVEHIEFPAGGRLVVFGPNGSGKSTLLRQLAGTVPGGPEIETAYLPQRPFVFKGSARRSLELGLDPLARARANTLAEALGVADLLDRSGPSLSGGERQRVMLAATLARAADLVLLDEPLAPLDLRDRGRVAATIVSALDNRSAIIVSHDLDSVATLGDLVAVMLDGRIRQSGRVAEVFVMPVDDEVASVVGVSNVLSGTIVAGGSGLVDVLCGPLTVVAIGELAVGSPAKVLFGAEAVGVFTGGGDGGSPRNVWSGRVERVRTLGRLTELVVDCGVPIAALITPGALATLDIAAGQEVKLAVKATAVRSIRAASET